MSRLVNLVASVFYFYISCGKADRHTDTNAGG